ncbi:hypothetical protein EMCRGX_G011625 [Ephydatia muelleri]
MCFATRDTLLCSWSERSNCYSTAGSTIIERFQSSIRQGDLYTIANQLSELERYSVIRNLYVPDSSFVFPPRNDYKKLPLYSWLTEHSPWLVYSKSQNGDGDNGETLMGVVDYSLLFSYAPPGNPDPRRVGWSFITPPLILLVMALVTSLLLVPDPRVVGMESPLVHGLGTSTPSSPSTDGVSLIKAKSGAVGFLRAFLIPGVVEFSLAFFFVKMVNYVFKAWLPFYIATNEVGGRLVGGQLAGWLSSLFDVGGVVGVVGVGDLNGRRTLVITVLEYTTIPLLHVFHSYRGVSEASLSILLLVCGCTLQACYITISTAVTSDLPGVECDLLLPDGSQSSGGSGICPSRHDINKLISHAHAEHGAVLGAIPVIPKWSHQVIVSLMTWERPFLGWSRTTCTSLMGQLTGINLSCGSDPHDRLIPVSCSIEEVVLDHPREGLSHHGYFMKVKLKSLSRLPQDIAFLKILPTSSPVHSHSHQKLFGHPSGPQSSPYPSQCRALGVSTTSDSDQSDYLPSLLKKRLGTSSWSKAGSCKVS